MNDPLIPLKPGPPCPSCGSRVSLRALRGLHDRLWKRKREIDLRRTIEPIEPLDIIGGVTIDGRTIAHDDGQLRPAGLGGWVRDVDGNVVGIDGEICADCGTFWKPDARDEGERLRKEIRELRMEVDSAVDILGDLVGDGG